MDKFEITEILRIYLPGLYFVMTIRYLTGLNISSTTIGVIGILAGLIIHSLHLAEKFYLIYVEKFHGSFWFPRKYKHNMFVDRRDIFVSKFDKHNDVDASVFLYLDRCQNDSFKREKNILSQALIAFDSGRHHNQEIKQMRLLSTLGYLKFLLSIISFSAFITSFLNSVHLITVRNFVSKFGFEYLDPFIFLIATVIFFHGAIQDKKLSLQFELGLYKNYTKEDLKNLGKHILYEINKRTV